MSRSMHKKNYVHEKMSFNKRWYMTIDDKRNKKYKKYKQDWLGDQDDEEDLRVNQEEEDE